MQIPQTLRRAGITKFLSLIFLFMMGPMAHLSAASVTSVPSKITINKAAVTSETKTTDQRLGNHVNIGYRIHIRSPRYFRHRFYHHRFYRPRFRHHRFYRPRYRRYSRRRICINRYGYRYFCRHPRYYGYRYYRRH